MMCSCAFRSAMCAAVVVVITGTAAAQTPPLGEVARKEAERRKEQAAAGKVYTSKDLPASAEERAQVPSPYADPAESDQAASLPATAVKPDATSEGTAKKPARDEAWWKARLAKAREDLRANEAAAESLEARIDALSRDFGRRNHPLQRPQTGEERDSVLEELALLRESIDRGRQEIDTIQEEARRAGVPPGWLR